MKQTNVLNRRADSVRTGIRYLMIDPDREPQRMGQRVLRRKFAVRLAMFPLRWLTTSAMD